MSDPIVDVLHHQWNDLTARCSCGWTRRGDQPMTGAISDEAVCVEEGCGHPQYQHTGRGGRCIEGKQKDTAAWRCDCRRFVAAEPEEPPAPMELAHARAVLNGDGPLWFADEALHREACAVVLAALDAYQAQAPTPGPGRQMDSRLGRRDIRVIEGEWVARAEET